MVYIFASGLLLTYASSKAPLSLNPFIVRLRDERLVPSFRTSVESYGKTSGVRVFQQRTHYPAQ